MQRSRRALLPFSNFFIPVLPFGFVGLLKNRRHELVQETLALVVRSSNDFATDILRFMHQFQ